MTVFPQPNAPGMAQVPPRTDGNRASRTRWYNRMPKETEFT